MIKMFSHRWARIDTDSFFVNEILTQISRIFARAPLVLSAMPSVGVRMVNANGVMRYL